MTNQNLKLIIYIASVFTLSLLPACGTDNQKTSTENTDVIMVDPSVETDVEAEAEVEAEVEEEEESETEVIIEAEPLPEDVMRNGDAELFGSDLSENIEFIDFDLLVANPFDFANRTIQTEGIVRANCNKRGCWMELRSPRDPESKRITVRFLDYGFFVPLDSRGALARVEGSAAVETLTPEEVEYYRAEGYDPGVVNEDGSVTAIEFTATGVEMWNRNED